MSAQNAKLLKKDGEVRKDAREAFVNSTPDAYEPDEPRVAAKTTNALATPMKDEYVAGLGTVTTTTGLEVETDLVGYLDELAKLSAEITSEIQAIHARVEKKKKGEVSTYAQRKLQDLTRCFNAAHERLGLICKSKP